MCKHRGKREVSKRPGRRPRSAASLLAAAAAGLAALLASSSWVAAAEKPEEDPGPPPLACEETALGTARTFMRQLGHRPERYRTSVVWEIGESEPSSAHVIFDPLESTGFDGYGLSVRVPVVLSQCRVFEPFELRAEWCSPWNDRCRRPLSARQERLRRIALGRMKDRFGEIARDYEPPSPPESDASQTPDESVLTDRCILAVYRRAVASNDPEDFHWWIYEMPGDVTLVASPKRGLDPCEETRFVRPYYGSCGKGIPTEEARAVLSGEASASDP